MRRLEDDTGRAEEAPGPPAARTTGESTGLPWLRTWRGVYVLVMVCFVIWVGLLVALSVIFS
jgi:hypothetical protein